MDRYLDNIYRCAEGVHCSQCIAPRLMVLKVPPQRTFVRRGVVVLALPASSLSLAEGFGFTARCDSPERANAFRADNTAYEL